MGATPTHLSKLDRVQATMEQIGGFKAGTLAARREAAGTSTAERRGWKRRGEEKTFCVMFIFPL